MNFCDLKGCQEQQAFDIAIKALKQQPCEDAISREAVEKITWEEPSYDDVLNVLTEVRDKVRVLPSVTPQQARWIPVSERLPEENIHVLCQFYMGGMGECYHAHDYWHIVGGFRIKIDDVLAWMPLPQPYKAESEDEE